MNLATKKRLVGTIVLGSLALIIIPLLLDGEGVEPLPVVATMPPAPVVPTMPIPDPIRPVIIADTREDGVVGGGLASDPADGNAVAEAAPEAEDAAAPQDVEQEQEQEQTEAPEEFAKSSAANDDAAQGSTLRPETAGTQPRLDERGLPESWTVRLGSFGNKANADALLERLLAADYKAYQRPVQSDNGGLSGVFVGPVLTRREAEALKAELVMSFQLNGLVMQFELEP